MASGSAGPALWRCCLWQDPAEPCAPAYPGAGIYRQLVSHMKDHFGDDAKGKRKAFYFLPWHFNFFCRHRCVRHRRALVRPPSPPRPTTTGPVCSSADH